MGPRAPPRSEGILRLPCALRGGGLLPQQMAGRGREGPLVDRDSMLKVMHGDQEHVLGAVGGGAPWSCTWAAEMRSPSVVPG